MSLRLCDFYDMHQLWDVILACDLGGIGISFEQPGIIPAAHLIQVITPFTIVLETGITLKSLQNGMDVFLHHLELVGDRDAIAIVIDRDDGGRLQNADGIERLPEHPFSCGGIANAREYDLVPVFRKLGEIL